MGVSRGLPTLAPLPKSAADIKAELKAAYWDLLREQKVRHAT